MFNKGGGQFVAPWSKTTSVSAAVNLSREVPTMRKNQRIGKRPFTKWGAFLDGSSLMLRYRRGMVRRTHPF